MLTVSTAATSTRLTTVSAIKTELGLTTNSDDAWLLSAIDRASDAIASFCDRTFAQEVVSETFRIYRYVTALSLERFPVTAIASVVEDGVTLVAGTDYECDLTAGTLHRIDNRGRYICWAIATTVVSYTAGYLLPGQAGRSLPNDIEQAAIMLVTAAWNARGRDPMVKTEAVEGVGSTGYIVPGAADGGFPPGVAAMHERYRVPAMG